MLLHQVSTKYFTERMLMKQYAKKNLSILVVYIYIYVHKLVTKNIKFKTVLVMITSYSRQEKFQKYFV